MKNIFLVILIMTIVSSSFTSCSDFLETNSSTDINEDVALSNTSNLDKVLLATYKGLLMGGNVNSADRGLSGLTGMLSYYDLAGVDITAQSTIGTSEFTAYSFSDARTQAIGGYTAAVWTQFYDHINRCNIIIDALDDAIGSTDEKLTISGQAKAIRAISYFQLILTYQQTYNYAKTKRGVILRLHSNDPESMPFSTVEKVYTQIVKDLEDAKSELDGYDPDNVWRIRTDVVCAWLARVYQVMGNWDEALANAKIAYQAHSTLMTKDEWCSGFDDLIQNNVAELIWGYQNTDETNVGDGCPHAMWFNADPELADSEGYSPNIYSFHSYFVSQQWVDLFNNDLSDYRASRLNTTPEDVENDPSKSLTDSQVQSVMLWHRCGNSDFEIAHKWAYNKFKHYGVDNKCRPDICLIRASEMLLVMAESEANLGNTTTALGYLNTLQNARNVSVPTTTLIKEDLLEEIYVERRKELLGEGVTGMYDNCRLQKSVTRIGSFSENNYAGHFINYGLNYWGTPSSGNKSSVLKPNDYHYFLQIPEDEFAKNTEISNAEQNPFKGE